MKTLWQSSTDSPFISSKKKTDSLRFQTGLTMRSLKVTGLGTPRLSITRYVEAMVKLS